MAIKLTRPAAERVHSFLNADGGLGLRLGVKKTGCSGWAYTVQLTDQVHPEDVIFEDHGIKIIVAPENLGFLDGSEIDYSAQGLSQSFVFNNPNATEQCGCGESFTIN